MLSLIPLYAVNGRCNVEVPQCGSVGPGLLFRSMDSGNTWQDVSLGLPDRLAITSAYANGNSCYIGTLDGDLYHSAVSITQVSWITSTATSATDETIMKK